MNLENYELCELHGCPVIQITEQAEKICLTEWINHNCLNQLVVDVVIQDDGRTDLVLENGMLLAAKDYKLLESKHTRAPIIMPKSGIDRLNVMNNRRVVRANEFDPLDYRVLLTDEKAVGIEVYLDEDRMLDQLVDMEMVKYEP
ncbi:MAG: hypothetical protein JEZ06_15050 [Anaerolineaceae bacterium]|nr:hypothetical protein [Anaerolineaceae bacterium]